MTSVQLISVYLGSLLLVFGMIYLFAQIAEKSSQ
jgi:hypothetical protein